MLQVVEHPHFVVGLMRSWVIEEIQVLQRSQHLDVLDDAIEIPELVVVEDESLYMFEDVENAIDSLDLVILKKEMLESEVLLQAFESSKVVVVQPQDFQVGKVIKVDKDGGLAIAEMHLCGLLGLFEVFDGNDVPWIGLDLVQ